MTGKIMSYQGFFVQCSDLTEKWLLQRQSQSVMMAYRRGIQFLDLWKLERFEVQLGVKMNFYGALCAFCCCYLDFGRSRLYQDRNQLGYGNHFPLTLIVKKWLYFGFGWLPFCQKSSLLLYGIFSRFLKKDILCWTIELVRSSYAITVSF